MTLIATRSVLLGTVLGNGRRRVPYCPPHGGGWRALRWDEEYGGPAVSRAHPFASARIAHARDSFRIGTSVHGSLVRSDRRSAVRAPLVRRPDWVAPSASA